VNDKDLAKMSTDELWALFEEVRAILSRKLGAEMHELQRRLAKINAHDKISGHDKINGHDGKPGNETKAHRRPYPKVYPKYRNPDQPSETWSGRGVQPRWVRAQLRSGKRFDDLLISRPH
jgi:DNA-binding protein H-NS